MFLPLRVQVSERQFRPPSSLLSRGVGDQGARRVSECEHLRSVIVEPERACADVEVGPGRVPEVESSSCLSYDAV